MVKVAIVGAGTLGIKIAGEIAYHGHRVKIHDVNPSCLNSIYCRMKMDKEELQKEGLLTTEEYMGTVLIMSRLEETVNDADLIFEAVIDDLDVKMDLFERITCSCKSDAVICTNSLNLKINDIFSKSEGRERCLGLRFLFPVFSIPEVEMTPGQHTSQANVQKVRNFLEEMGKTVFFREGKHPLILSQKQIQERKNACILQMHTSSVSGNKSVPSFYQQMVSHSGTDATMNKPYSEECAICMERIRNGVICPCHHLVACYECTKILLNRKDACPICRKDILEVIKVHHS